MTEIVHQGLFSLFVKEYVPREEITSRNMQNGDAIGKSGQNFSILPRNSDNDFKFLTIPAFEL